MSRDDSYDVAGRVVFGCLPLAVVALILWSGHREGRTGFAAMALAVSLVPGIAGVAVAAWRARRRDRPLSERGLAIGAFAPSALVFAIALWASGEPPLELVAKSLSAGCVVMLAIAGAWIAARGFPDAGSESTGGASRREDL